jgi:hypothetical protein
VDTADSGAWAHEDVPLDRPNVARMYDYFLGGGHNFAVDRQAARHAISLWPDLPLMMQANRAFLRRTVTFLVAEGIEQFLDLGSGIPTAGNVHEVAQRQSPTARVVYVDVDPVAVAHSRSLLRGNALATVVQADARRPEQVLGDPETGRLLDLGRPVAVLAVALLHFIPADEQVRDLMAGLGAATAPGSYLVLSHATAERVPQEMQDQAVRIYSGSNSPFHFRSREEITRLFEGFELVEPGLTYLPGWRPEAADDLFLDEPERSLMFGGVGKKP